MLDVCDDADFLIKEYVIYDRWHSWRVKVRCTLTEIAPITG